MINLTNALQPFKLGDRVGVAYSSAAPSLSGGAQGAWFEGVCEKVDLRCVVGTLLIVLCTF